MPHLYLDLRRGLFLSGFPTNSVCSRFINLTMLAYLILLDLIIEIFAKGYNYETPHCEILSFTSSRVALNILPSNLYSFTYLVSLFIDPQI
jgi:hypothetical protein